MFDFDDLKIPIYTGINDAPVAPTSTTPGNGSHLILLHNNFVDEVESGLNALSVALPTDAIIPESSVGTFTKTDTATKYVSGLLGTNSAIKIVFPENTSIFISEWAFTFRNPNDAFDIKLNLSGHYTSNTFAHYQNSYLNYGWQGFYPSSFGIFWYSQLRFADNLDLATAPTDKLAFSIYRNGAIRELHVYNKTSFATHFVSTLTCCEDI